MTRSLHRAFSIVEVIVVLAIVAVLMSLALTVLSMTRENVRRVLCMSQLRQIGHQTHNYIDANRQANGDKGPLPGFLFSFSPGNSNTIVILVQPKKAATSGWSNYDRRLMVCPTDEDPGTIPVLNDQGIRDDWKCSYGYNIDLILSNVNYWRMGAPSRTAIFYDGSMSGDDSKGKGSKNIQGHYFTSKDYVGASMTNRHRYNKANVLFMDWHVETLTELTDDQVYVNSAPIGAGNGNGGGGNGGGGGGNGGGGNGGGGGGNGNGNGK